MSSVVLKAPAALNIQRDHIGSNTKYTFPFTLDFSLGTVGDLTAFIPNVFPNTGTMFEFDPATYLGQAVIAGIKSLQFTFLSGKDGDDPVGTLYIYVPDTQQEYVFGQALGDPGAVQEGYVVNACIPIFSASLGSKILIAKSVDGDGDVRGQFICSANNFDLDSYITYGGIGYNVA